MKKGMSSKRWQKRTKSSDSIFKFERFSKNFGPFLPICLYVTNVAKACGGSESSSSKPFLNSNSFRLQLSGSTDLISELLYRKFCGPFLGQLSFCSLHIFQTFSVVQHSEKSQQKYQGCEKHNFNILSELQLKALYIFGVRGMWYKVTCFTHSQHSRHELNLI